MALTEWLLMLMLAFSMCGSTGAQFFLQGHMDALNEEDAHTLAAHYEKLLSKYAAELKKQAQASRSYRNHMIAETNTNEWRAKHSARAARAACRGSIGQLEASMLYIMLREEQPDLVVEIGALCGSSTVWMLAALRANDKGKLVTFDLHTPPSLFTGARPRS